MVEQFLALLNPLAKILPTQYSTVDVTSLLSERQYDEAHFSAMPAWAGDAAAGESVFSGNCAACHAGGQNVIMPEKTLQQEALEEYLDGGANVKAVITQVTNGKNAMPAFGGRLSDEDIENVATYVINTAKSGW